MSDLTEALREIVRSEIEPAMRKLEELERRLDRGPANDLLRAEEVEERYQISRTTLYRLRRAGDLHAVTIGRRVLFRREDLEALASSDPPPRGPG